MNTENARKTFASPRKIVQWTRLAIKKEMLLIQMVLIKR